MIKVIDFVSLDTLGVKLFHVGPIWRMPKLICIFIGRMWCIIIMCIVHIVNMIRNGAMLIVECMKAKSMITLHKAQNIIFISTVMHPIYL